MSHDRFPHRAVLHVCAGEDDRGKAVYADYALSSVYVEALRETEIGQTALQPKDRLRLYLFARGSRVTGPEGQPCAYALPSEWDAMTEQERARAFTFHAARDRLDYEAETYSITGAQAYLNGSPRTRHWEVTAK